MTDSGRNYTVDNIRPDSVEDLAIMFPEFHFGLYLTAARNDQNSRFQVSPRSSRLGPGGTWIQGARLTWIQGARVPG